MACALRLRGQHAVREGEARRCRLQGRLAPVRGAMRRHGVRVPLVALVLGLAAAPSPAAGRTPTLRKAIWGPARVGAVAQFPIYKDLGARIWHSALQWSAWHRRARRIRPTRGIRPTSGRPASTTRCRRPVAPGYESAAADGHAPLGQRWPGDQLGSHTRQDLADFAAAASRRYPYVRYWVVWGEPTRQPNFMPLRPRRRERR